MFGALPRRLAGIGIGTVAGPDRASRALRVCRSIT